MSDLSTAPPHPIHEAEVSKSGNLLQGLVRSLEKSGLDDLDDKEIYRLISLLESLIPSVARRGLLLGDQDSAKKLVALSVDAKDFNSSRTKNKRGKQRPDALTDGGASSDVSSKISATLILPSIIRILGGNQQLQQQQEQKEKQSSKLLTELAIEDQFLLLLLASDLCTAICEHVRQHKQQTGLMGCCVQAEYDLIVSNSKPLLVGLTKAIDFILGSSGSADDDSGAVLFPQEDMLELGKLALRSSHRAAVSLISLLGTRLSRNTTQIQQLAAVGVWKSLSVLDSNILESACLLHATIPLAGTGGWNQSKSNSNTGQISPSDQWNASIKETVALLFVLLQSSVPINKSLAERAHQYETFLKTASGRDALTLWLERIGVAKSEHERISIFLHCIKVLVGMTKGFLSMQAMGSTQLVGAEMDVVSVLDLVEIMMSFPMSAELIYFGTKKRLRKENLESGQFSPVAITNMANQVKVLGHQILDSLVSCLQTAVLLPYARRLLKTCFASLLASCSTALRNVLEDNKGSTQTDRSRQRWLSSSVVVRTTALNSVKQILLTVGTEVCSTRSNSFGVGNRGGDVDRWIDLVCGCVVEQLQTHENSDDWGSSQERNDCLVASIECLSAFLVSNGPFLSNTARSLVDSVTKTLILKCPVFGGGRVSDMSQVHVCVLHLGIHSCSTPWSDGAPCSLRPCLRTLAERLQKTEAEGTVLLVASAAIRICDTFDTPRVPALTVVTRTHVPPRNGIDTAQVMAERLEQAGAELEASLENRLDQEKECKRRKIEEKENKQNGPLPKPLSKTLETKLTNNDQESESPRAKSSPQKTPQDPPDNPSDNPKKGHLGEMTEESDEKDNASPAVSNAKVSPAPVSSEEQRKAPTKPLAEPKTEEDEESDHEERSKTVEEDEEESGADDIPMICDAPPDDEDE